MAKLVAAIAEGEAELEAGQGIPAHEVEAEFLASSMLVRCLRGVETVEADTADLPVLLGGAQLGSEADPDGAAGRFRRPAALVVEGVVVIAAASGMLCVVGSPVRVFVSHTSELRRLPGGRSFVVDRAHTAAAIEASEGRLCGLTLS